mmetsp:Transcript_12028/g.38072  ORF Transcript_12028/g.38072 Transcript_12028/m.38072 type:complete len:475 (+) Transcript_12028:20-1444(+)
MPGLFTDWSFPPSPPPLLCALPYRYGGLVVVIARPRRELSSFQAQLHRHRRPHGACGGLAQDGRGGGPVPRLGEEALRGHDLVPELAEEHRVALWDVPRVYCERYLRPPIGWPLPRLDREAVPGNAALGRLPPGVPPGIAPPQRREEERKEERRRGPPPPPAPRGGDARCPRAAPHRKEGRPLKVYFGRPNSSRSVVHKPVPLTLHAVPAMDHALDPSLPMSAPPRQNMQGGSNVTPLATRTNALEGRSSPIVVSSQPQSTETEQYPPPMAFVPLKMTKMHAYVECHVTTAFVTLECSCYAPTHYQPSDCVLSLPLHGEGTITDVEVFNGNRVYTTTVVPNTELGGMSAAKGGEAGQYQKADPENFILTFPNVRPGDMLALRVTWMQPLLFSEGKYKFSMPLKFPPDFLDDPSRPINSYLSISCEVNTGSPEPVKWGGTQHPIKVLSEIDGQVKLEADASAAWPNGDFEIEYSV